MAVWFWLCCGSDRPGNVHFLQDMYKTVNVSLWRHWVVFHSSVQGLCMVREHFNTPSVILLSLHTTNYTSNHKHHLATAETNSVLCFHLHLSASLWGSACSHLKPDFSVGGSIPTLIMKVHWAEKPQFLSFNKTREHGAVIEAQQNPADIHIHPEPELRRSLVWLSSEDAHSISMLIVWWLNQ